MVCSIKGQPELAGSLGYNNNTDVHNDDVKFPFMVIKMG